MLYDIVLKKKQDTSGITCNPIMDAFDLNLCKALDYLAINDRFVYNRLEKASKELQLTSGIDYNAHYNSAFDAYNEAAIYYLLQQKGFDIKNVPEEKRPTPDFEVIFLSKFFISLSTPLSSKFISRLPQCLNSFPTRKLEFPSEETAVSSREN